ncbi:hypothetical protein PIROE2DRAFT_17877 [Piromyces sp. E2]|nr:hypothetical protein PIROE2DRAFT_17877 [Piromyces sp. E2]|eukprot:OUM57203.1 hypothetical protein PIROE2DRAFT_17877 [Piromyces sp. E2]
MDEQLRKYLQNDEFENFKKYYSINDIPSAVTNQILIHKKINVNFSCSIDIDGRKYIPLSTAIEYHDFELADDLIETYNADINYERDNMIDSVLSCETINIKQLEYLQSKLKVKMDNNFIIKIIKNPKNNKLLGYICSQKRFNDALIKDLLFIYRDCKKERENIKEDKKKFEEGYQKFLNEQRKKANTFIMESRKNFSNVEELYQEAIKEGNNKALKIINENDGDDDEIILKRCIEYNLLEKAVSINDRKWVWNIMRDVEFWFSYRYLGYEKIFAHAIKNMKDYGFNNKDNEEKKAAKNIIFFHIYYYICDSTLIDDNLMKRLFIHTNTILNICLKLDKGNFGEYLDMLVDALNYERKTFLNLNLNEPDINGHYPLLLAIERKDHKNFKCLIDHGATTSIKSFNNISLFLYTIQINDKDFVDTVLSRSDVKDIKKEIDEAIIKSLNNNSNNRNNNFEIAKLLLAYAEKHQIKININRKIMSIESNTDVSIKNNLSLFGKAIQTNDKDIVNTILSLSDVKDIEKEINEAIRIAFYNNNNKIAKLLLNYADEHRVTIDIDIKNGNGKKYLLIDAIKKKNIEFLIALNICQSYKRPLNKNDVNFTPLILSYKLNFMEIFNFLLYCYDINEVDSLGNNLLYYAIDKNDTESTLNLIKSGINTNHRNQKGISIFDYIMDKNKSPENEILEFLIENDCISLNTKDREGNTPLHKIIENNKLSPSSKIKLVETMIKNGSDVNTYNSKKQTPLNLAIRENESSLVTILLENGSINIKNDYGNYSMDIALGGCDKRIRESLINHNFIEIRSSISDYQLQSIIDNNEVKTLQMLLLHNHIDVNKKIHISRSTYSLLCYAVEKDNIDIIKCLLDHGAKDIENAKRYNYHYYQNYEKIKNLLENYQ